MQYLTRLSNSLLPTFLSSHYKSLCGILLILIIRSLLPTFLCGLLLGTLLSALAADVAANVWNTLLSLAMRQSHKNTTIPPGNPLDKKELIVPASLSCDLAEPELDRVVYKGWMNELAGDYDPHTYHVSQTYSVQIHLDKNILRISSVKWNVLRHAVWNEVNKKQIQITSERVFDMTGAQVMLRPKRLARCRWWSRKYPICLIFQPEAQLVGEMSKDSQSEPTLQGSDTNEPLPLARFESESSSRLTASASVNSMSTLKRDASVEIASDPRKIVVCLFARAHREKENWFHRLRRAACFYEYEKQDIQDAKLPSAFDSEMMTLGEALQIPPSTCSSASFEMDQSSTVDSLSTNSTSNFSTISTSNSERPSARKLSVENSSENSSHSKSLVGEWMMYASLNRQFIRFMQSFLATGLLAHSKGVCRCDLNVINDEKSATFAAEESKADPLAKSIDVAWINAVGARIMWDIIRDKEILNGIRTKIQRNLDKIRLPPFLETIRITGLTLGQTIPKITRVSTPTMNEWGLWIDLAFDYAGGVSFVIETKVNLMKLKSEKQSHVEHSGNSYADPDIPITPESSADEDEEIKSDQKTLQLGEAAGNAHKLSKQEKLVNLVDSVVHSKMFRRCRKNKHLRKAMQKISDTALILLVDIKSLQGTLAVNIPPPPTDRLWFGFRPMPNLQLEAAPKIGEQDVSIGIVKKFIEDKIQSVFEKSIVIPNMSDAIIPVMPNGLLSSFNM